MDEKDVLLLIELAKNKFIEAQKMSKREAILSLNRAGILTKKGEFKKVYSELEKIIIKNL